MKFDCSPLEGNSLKAVSQTRDEVVIYGQTIVLGYKNVEADDLILINREEVERGETDVARVRPASDQLSIFYTPDLENLGEGAVPVNTE